MMLTAVWHDQARMAAAQKTADTLLDQLDHVDGGAR